MRVPKEIAGRIGRGAGLGFACGPEGEVVGGFDEGWGDGAYPPAGYLPWDVLEVGNGDTYGYYWPIGREGRDPIVCTTMHDTWRFEPVASSLPACLRLLIVEEPDNEEAAEVAEDFGVETDVEVDADAGEVGLLEVDPRSPRLLVGAARQAAGAGRVEEAEKHLLAAVDAVPEYAEAWAGLARVYGQWQRPADAVRATMRALTCPMCFGARDRRKMLRRLQEMPDGAYAGEDPLWGRRKRLALAERGEGKENADYEVLEELIEAYHRAGEGARAVGLRVMVGERVSWETGSFQERMGWTWGLYRQLLRGDVERAGLVGRLGAVGSSP